MNNKRYYTNSAGEQVDVSTLETTHLVNAVRKKMVEIFNSPDKKTADKEDAEIEGLLEEYYKRYQKFYEGLE